MINLLLIGDMLDFFGIKIEVKKMITLEGTYLHFTIPVYVLRSEINSIKQIKKIYINNEPYKLIQIKQNNSPGMGVIYQTDERD